MTPLDTPMNKGSRQELGKKEPQPIWQQLVSAQ
jgi:hypothetical protein